ncbi:hypothetical protein MTO96_000839 [Rhipicephalus appendiculatus]
MRMRAPWPDSAGPYYAYVHVFCPVLVADLRRTCLTVGILPPDPPPRSLVFSTGGHCVHPTRTIAILRERSESQDDSGLQDVPGAKRDTGGTGLQQRHPDARCRRKRTLLRTVRTHQARPLPPLLLLPEVHLEDGSPLSVAQQLRGL